MASIHEVVKVESKWSWRGRKNTHFIKREPLRRGDHRVVDEIVRPSGLDSYVTLGIVREGNSIDVVLYQISPDDLDKIGGRRVKGRRINSDHALWGKFRFLL